MNESCRQQARDYLNQLHIRHHWPAGVTEEDVCELAALLASAVAAEREACAEIAVNMCNLRGSTASFDVSVEIRARGQEE